MAAEQHKQPAALDSHSPPLTLTVHFHGGLAPLFLTPPQNTLRLSLPALDPATSTPATLGTLIAHLDATYLASGSAAKRALFVQGGAGGTGGTGGYGVRPGILVLVDDADWELEGGEGCVLRGGEEVVFVSTLHGG